MRLADAMPQADVHLYTQNHMYIVPILLVVRHATLIDIDLGDFRDYNYSHDTREDRQSRPINLKQFRMIYTPIKCYGVRLSNLIEVSFRNRNTTFLVAVFWFVTRGDCGLECSC